MRARRTPRPLGTGDRGWRPATGLRRSLRPPTRGEGQRWGSRVPSSPSRNRRGPVVGNIGHNSSRRFREILRESPDEAPGPTRIFTRSPHTVSRAETAVRRGGGSAPSLHCQDEVADETKEPPEDLRGLPACKRCLVRLACEGVSLGVLLPAPHGDHARRIEDLPAGPSGEDDHARQRPPRENCPCSRVDTAIGVRV